MIVILVAGAVMCVGSIGGASFFIWKAARNARERDLEAMGFRVEVHGPPSSLTRVAEQSPMPGARVMRGQSITLTVAGRLIQ